MFEHPKGPKHPPLRSWVVPDENGWLTMCIFSTRTMHRSTWQRLPEAVSTCAIRTLKSDVTSGASDVTVPGNLRPAGGVSAVETDVIVTRQWSVVLPVRSWITHAGSYHRVVTDTTRLGTATAANEQIEWYQLRRTTLNVRTLIKTATTDCVVQW